MSLWPTLVLPAYADPRSASDTIYTGYDALNRVQWVSANANGSSPFAAYTYDLNTNGVGRLASETFASGPSQSVTGGYQYTYDARGRTTGQPTTWPSLAGPTGYPQSISQRSSWSE